jgi:urease subunit alpha
VLKAGFPAWGVIGDPNAAIEFAQPTVVGPQFGGYGAAPAEISVAFVSASAKDSGQDRLPTRRRRVAVRDTHAVSLADMMLNSRLGTVGVEAGTGAVDLDGERLHSAPAESV